MAKKGLIVSADEQIHYERIQSYPLGEISQRELASILSRTERHSKIEVQIRVTRQHCSC
jgi:hypothetical protein